MLMIRICTFKIIYKVGTNLLVCTFLSVWDGCAAVDESHSSRSWVTMPITMPRDKCRRDDFAVFCLHCLFEPSLSLGPFLSPSVLWCVLCFVVPYVAVQAVEEVPQSLVRELEGNDSMRSKFEALCRKAQNDICKQIEELDGEGKVS